MRRPCKTPVTREVLPYKILHCPLFMHKKHTHACIALRAKKVCRVNCVGFFEWAKQNEEVVEKILKKHEAPIRAYLRQEGNERQLPLITHVMPKGDNICEFCGKAFKTKGRLERHQEKKHRRQIFSKK